jgi:hypothetical protein
MWFTRCAEPGCPGPAEIVDRAVLESTAGPIEHVRLRCLHRHWFVLPLSMLDPGEAGLARHR